jgi:hypothetical protein
VSASAVLVVGIGLTLAVPLAWRVITRRFDPFEPIFVFALAYGVVFVARPASMLADGDLSAFGVDIRTTLPRALLLALVGGVAFICAYELGAGRALARGAPKPCEITIRAGVVGSVILITLSLSALLVMVWPAGGYRRFTILLDGQTFEVQELYWRAGSYFFMGAMLIIPAAILLLGLAVRDRRFGLIVGATLTFAFALLLMVPLGARGFLLPLVGGAVTFTYVTHGARPRLATVGLLAMLALVVSYTLTVVRSPDQRAHLSEAMRHVIERPDTPIQFVLHGEDAAMAPVLAAALHVVPSRLEYRYGGAVFGDLATRPIPRQLWAGKPQPVEEQLVGAIWPRLAKFGFNPAFPPVLFFYWDFGVLGVFAGMALFGIVCRTLYEWFLRHRASVSAQLIFATALWFIVLGVRNSPVDTIVFASFVVLPLVLIERFSSLRRPIIRPIFARARLSQR